MQSCENVIISIQLREHAVDMELPAFFPIKELSVKLEETFRIMYPQITIEPHTLQLVHEGNLLQEADTLAAAGIWDGSSITCMTEGRA